jgi:hypothetical protein
MNWYIFAWTVGPFVLVAALGLCHHLGHRKGYGEGYACGESDTRDMATEDERIAFNNGQRKGYQAGIDHQKRVYAEREQEAKKHGGNGRYIKRGATVIEPI